MKSGNRVFHRKWVGVVLASFLISTIGVCRIGMATVCRSPSPQPDLSKDIGFYSINSPQIPPAIRQAAQSVFILRVPTITDDNSYGIIDVSNGKGAAFIKKIQAIQPNDSFDSMDKTVAIEEIKRCEHFVHIDDQKQCLVVLTNTRGTGFLAGNNHTIWTNAHVVEGFLNIGAKFGKQSIDEQLLSKQRIDVFVFDQNGRLILNPLETKMVPTIVPQKTEVAVLRNTFYAEDTDYVALSVDKDLGKPLPIATNTAFGERIFIPGYPHCTGCDLSGIDTSSKDLLDFQNRRPKPNSSGHGLEVTTGHVLQLDQVLSFYGVNSSVFNLFRTDRMLFLSADDTDGDSGSPVLNGNGEVIGLLAGGKSKMINGQFTHVTRGVIPPALNRNTPVCPSSTSPNEPVLGANFSPNRPQFSQPHNQ